MQTLEILIIILFNICAFWKTIFLGIVTDDKDQYEKVRERPWKQHTLTQKIYSAIPLRLYGGATFGPDNTKLDHIVTLFLHTFTCILIYFVFHGGKIGLITAILYSCNPTNHQTSIWLNGRRYSIATSLILLMLLCGPWGIPFYLLSGAFHITGLFAPVILAYKYPMLLIFIPIFLGAGLQKMKQTYVERRKNIFDKDQVYFTPKRLIIVTKCYGFSFFRMFGIGETLMLYPIIQGWGITVEGNKQAYSFDRVFWKGIIAFLFSILGFFMFKGQEFYYWMFICLGVLQWCAILPAVQLNTDRYTSITNVFMMYFVAKFLLLLGIWNLIPYYALIIYYGIKLSSLFEMYKDLPSFYDYHLNRHPNIVSVSGARIVELMEEKNPEKAWEYTINALNHNPNDYSLCLLAAVVCTMKGLRNLALIYLNRCTKNYYIGKEEFEKKEIEGIRQQIMKLPINPAMQLKGWTTNET